MHPVSKTNKGYQEYNSHTKLNNPLVSQKAGVHVDRTHNPYE